jgi:hypothetical protein
VIDHQQIEALVAQEVERQQAGIAAEREAERAAAEQKAKQWHDAVATIAVSCGARLIAMITSWIVRPRCSNSATVVWRRSPA